MPFERIDINKRWPIPAWVKLVLFLLVIFGLLMHNCWKKSQGSNILISDIKLAEFTSVSADIKFTVANRAEVELTKALKISIFSSSGRLIADKLTNVTIPAKSHKRFLKVLQKFNFPINARDEIDEIKIEIYK